MSQFHTSVMLQEALEFLNVKPGEVYIDATLGGAGHTQGILDAGGKVLAFDHDPEALKVAQKRLEGAYPAPRSFIANKAPRGTALQPFLLVTQNFTHLTEVVSQHHLGQVSGILFDLGPSNYQLTSQDRGFSFLKDAPLDMRMDPNLGVTAADLINALSQKELYALFTNLAQEKLARPIAAALVRARLERPITTTGQLASIIEQTVHRRGRLHPATKIFLALRLAVNDELNNLRAALPQAVGLLKPGGRLVIISFHESEDRIVKHFLLDQALNHTMTLLTKKPVTPSSVELAANPRSRSAKLRVAVKI